MFSTLPRGVPRTGHGRVRAGRLRHADADRDVPDRARADHLRRAPGTTASPACSARTTSSATAPGNPLLARLVDRFGQRRMLLPASAVHARRGGRAGRAARERRAGLVAARCPAVVIGFSLPVGRLAGARALVVRAGRPPGADHGVLARVVARRGDLRPRPADRHVHRDPRRPGDRALRRVARCSASARCGWPSQRATEPPPQRSAARRTASALRAAGHGAAVAGRRSAWARSSPAPR